MEKFTGGIPKEVIEILKKHKDSINGLADINQILIDESSMREERKKELLEKIESHRKAIQYELKEPE